jgi:hypothetical protein
VKKAKLKMEIMKNWKQPLRRLILSCVGKRQPNSESEANKTPTNQTEIIASLERGIDSHFYIIFFMNGEIEIKQVPMDSRQCFSLEMKYSRDESVASIDRITGYLGSKESKQDIYNKCQRYFFG